MYPVRKKTLQSLCAQLKFNSVNKNPLIQLCMGGFFMTEASKLLKNTLFLTGGTAVMRLCVLCFQAYLSKKAGAEILGIYGVAASVGAVFATVAISGVRFSVTRLASEHMSDSGGHPRLLMRCAFLYALCFGLFSGVVMNLSSQMLSEHWLMNASASSALRIMSYSMPLISVGATIQGYYTARQKILWLVTAEIVAQLLRMLFVAVCFEYACLGSPIEILATGMLLGEAFLSVFLLIIYMCDAKGGKAEQLQSG